MINEIDRRSCKINVPHSDEQLLALGHVAAQWAFLENELSSLAAVMLSEERRSHNDFLEPRTQFPQLMKLIRNLAKDHFGDGLASALSEITTRASNLKSDRDVAVHGVIATILKPGQNVNDGKVKMVATRHIPFPKHRTFPDDTEKLKTLADSISALSWDLLQVRLRIIQEYNKPPSR